MDTVPILLRQNSDGTITNDLAEENAKAASKITVNNGNGKTATKKFGSVEDLQQSVALIAEYGNGSARLITLSELIQRGMITEQHARDITKQLSMTEIEINGRTVYVPSYQANGLMGAFTDGIGTQTGNMMMPTGGNVGSTKSDNGMLRTVGGEKKLQQTRSEENEIDSLKATYEYTQLGNHRKEIGVSPFSDKSGNTVACINLNENRYFGVNSSITQESQNKTKALRQQWLERIEWIPTKSQRPKHLGYAQSLTHAEAHSLITAFEALGSLPKKITMFVDRKTCNICRGELPALLKTIGVDELVIYCKGLSKPITIFAEKGDNINDKI